MLNHPAIHTISIAQLKKMIDKDTAFQFIDVRTPFEYKKGHIKPAVNIDYMGKKFGEKFNSFDKKKPVYLYCQSGNRSSKAAWLLAKEGFTEIYDLEGGILKWNKLKP